MGDEERSPVDSAKEAASGVLGIILWVLVMTGLILGSSTILGTLVPLTHLAAEVCATAEAEGSSCPGR